MPISTQNLEWLNANSVRSYPLAYNASALDTTGTFEIPHTFILSLYLPVHAGLDVEPTLFFIRSITIFGTGYSVSISYDDGTGNYPTVASTIIPTASHTDKDSYALVGTGDYDDTQGKIVIGDLSDMADVSPGQYLFTPEGGRLEEDCIRPMIRGISSITLINGNTATERIYGDIELVAGTNMRLTPVITNPVGGDPVRKIIFDAIDGEGLNEDCACEGDPNAPPVRRINGIAPTAAGDFTLQGNDCLEIEAITNGLKLSDVCSEPCCGCTELERITEDLEGFGDSATTITNFVNRLETEVTQMSNVVLGSRLNDDQCISCD